MVFSLRGCLIFGEVATAVILGAFWAFCTFRPISRAVLAEGEHMGQRRLIQAQRLPHIGGQGKGAFSAALNRA